jgi:hypothetical protein
MRPFIPKFIVQLFLLISFFSFMHFSLHLTWYCCVSILKTFVVHRHSINIFYLLKISNASIESHCLFIFKIKMLTSMTFYLLLPTERNTASIQKLYSFIFKIKILTSKAFYPFAAYSIQRGLSFLEKNCTPRL